MQVDAARHATASLDWVPGGRRAGWVVGRWVDFGFIGGGSIVVYFACRHWSTFASSTWLITVAASLVWVCNYPHFAATCLRLYGRRDCRRQFPLTSWLVPAVLVGVLLAAFASPLAFAPWLVKLYILWSPWHYSGQTRGLTLLYARRLRFTFSNSEKLLITMLIFGTFVVASSRVEVGVAPRSYFGVEYFPLGLPEWFPRLLQLALWACVISLAAIVLGRRMRTHCRIPLIVFTPLAAQFIWFTMTGAGNYVYFVPLFHSLQYLFIAWIVQLGGSSLQRSPLRYSEISLRTMTWYAIAVLVGIVLFWAFPRLSRVSGRPDAFCTGVVLIIVQLHHFFVDGVIWKLRDTRVRSPLMTSLRALHSGPESRTS